MPLRPDLRGHDCLSNFQRLLRVEYGRELSDPDPYRTPACVHSGLGHKQSDKRARVVANDQFDITGDALFDCRARDSETVPIS
jgi:hypothetical protein